MTLVRTKTLELDAFGLRVLGEAMATHARRHRKAADTLAVESRRRVERLAEADWCDQTRKLVDKLRYELAVEPYYDATEMGAIGEVGTTAGTDHADDPDRPGTVPERDRPVRQDANAQGARLELERGDDPDQEAATGG